MKSIKKKLKAYKLGYFLHIKSKHCSPKIIICLYYDLPFFDFGGRVPSTELFELYLNFLFVVVILS